MTPNEQALPVEAGEVDAFHEAEAIWNDALWHFNPDWKTEDGFEGSRDRAIKSIARALQLHDHVATLSQSASGGVGSAARENQRLRAVLEKIAARSLNEMGCYYSNIASIKEARAALAAPGQDEGVGL